MLQFVQLCARHFGFLFPCGQLDLRGEFLHADRANVAGAGLERMRGLRERRELARLLGRPRLGNFLAALTAEQIDHLQRELRPAQFQQALDGRRIEWFGFVHDRFQAGVPAGKSFWIASSRTFSSTMGLVT